MNMVVKEFSFKIIKVVKIIVNRLIFFNNIKINFTLTRIYIRGEGTKKALREGVGRGGKGCELFCANFNFLSTQNKQIF